MSISSTFTSEIYFLLFVYMSNFMILVFRVIKYEIFLFEKGKKEIK